MWEKALENTFHQKGHARVNDVHKHSDDKARNNDNCRGFAELFACGPRNLFHFFGHIGDKGLQ
jgi:hypothetical protein